MMNKKMPMMALMVLIMLVSILYVMNGIGMHDQVAVEEAKFHALNTEYFSIAKAERDSAGTGSELNTKLVEIKNYPSQLLELKLVGVGKILTGIYALLFGILIALMMMPVRLGMIMKK